MAGQKFTLTFDANLEVSKMKSALGEIQKGLNGLQLPQNITKGLQSTFQKLSEEIRNFEVQAGKDITGKADFAKLEKSAEKINNLFERLRIQVKDLGNLSGKDLQKLLPDSVAKNITNANNALKAYNNTLKSIQKTIDGVNGKIAEQQNKLKSYQAAIQQLIANKSTKVYDQLKQTVQNTDGTTRFETEAEALERLKKAYQTVEEQLVKYQQKVGQNPTSGQQTYITRLVNQIEKLKKAYKDLEAEGNKNLQLDNQIKALEGSAKTAQNQITKLQADLQRLLQGKQGQEAQALQTLLNALQQIQGIDFSKFSKDAQGAGDAVQHYLNENLQKLVQNLQKTEGHIGQQGSVFKNFRQQVIDAGAELTNFDNRMREVEQLKSRIQYFFGLNNTIQLVKRTMRDAYNTIKELDKAMTETAVVTDFSVGDMWAQLPEYTKRANELGVTTKAAYEAATLYYQQGLKTNEVMAISNETLKMARIAGLDAAVATDRMTNAVRGFNMEINEVNTQRVNDVYSRLAAISASNVDEISTAMTKVASLAHNAGMEFETTAAFLAQIIETTRESAETAGTALKTVVARFSEVKKLVGEGELKGADEEGEIIDVNKVSQALRTAGIDLNKYFLGEVGIDDIFMELASKWDSLTTLQQRYIATQAAGSRQQSRFIALMSDYARTQELVGEAYESNGASAKQFEKTQESLESKLARLKNAWDEFAMGIANSDLVKLGVDALTGLLNIINSLTSGFGTLDTGAGKFLNTFSKLAILIGGLKVGKGLAAGFFGSMLGAATGGKFGGGFTPIAARAMGVNPGKNLLSTLGKGAISPFKNLTAGIGGGLQSLGETKTLMAMGGSKALGARMAGGTFAKLTGMGMAEGGALGLAGVASLLPAIIGIGAAAGVAFVAVKKLYDASPEGQVKIAEKYAKSMEEVSKAAKQTAADYQNVQEEYNSLNDAVNNASNLEERTEAIKSRSEYVKSLIEQNSVYAQYLEDTKFENGEFYLTLDSEKLETACNNIAKAAVEAAAANNLAQSNLAYQEYEKYAAQYEQLQQHKLEVEANSEDITSKLRIGDWTNVDEQNLIDLQARMQEKLAESTNFAMQTATSYIQNSGLSDIASSYLVQAIGDGLSSDVVSKRIKEASKQLSGNLDEQYKIAFRDLPEDLDDKSKKMALAVRNANINLAKEFDAFIKGFSQLPTDAQKVLYEISSNNGQGLTEDQYKKIANTSPEQWFQYKSNGQTHNILELIPTEEMREEILNAFKSSLKEENPFDVLRESINKIFADPSNSTLNDVFNSIVDTFKLTADEASVLPRLFDEFMVYGQGTIDEFSTFLTNLVKAVPKNKRNELFELLGNLNFQDNGNLKVFLDSLDDLDINWDSINTTADEALEHLTNSAEKFDAESFKEEIVDNVSLIRDIKDRNPNNSGYRTFSQDEYNLLKASGISDDEFAFSGIKNKEWTYTGESLDNLIDVLVNGLTQKVVENEATIDEEIAQGQWVESLGSEITEALTQIVNSGELTQEQVDEQKWISDIITHFRGEEALGLPPEKLLEILKTAFQYYNSIKDNTDTKEMIQRHASQPMDYITPINEFRAGISEKDYEVAVKSKFFVDEHAEDRYENILKSIRQIEAANSKWNKTQQQQETIARALAVNWSEQAAKLTKLTEVLDKNDKILANSTSDADAYSGAIHAVGEAMRDAYGEQVTDEFVQAHIQQIVLARESEDAYQELLDLLQQDFFSNAIQGGNEFQQQLWDLQQALIDCGVTAEQLDGFKAEGVAVLDGTPWMDVIAQLWGNLEAFEAYLATSGWSVVYGPKDENGIPTSAQLVRNQPTGYGGYQPYTGNNWGRGSSSTPKEPKKEEWKSDLDWLYNLLEDLTEIEREQKELQEEQNKILELGDDSTGLDLYNNLIKQLANLETQRSYQQNLQNYRRREMDEFMSANAGYGQYFRFNDRDQTLEINWDAINNIGDKETYEKVKQLVSEAEAIQDKMDEAEDSLRDVEKQIRNLQNIWRQEYAEFEQRVLDALVKSYQRVIDNYSDLHNTITDSSNKILEAIEKEVNLERQIRDNTKTEDEISDMEARLAFLRRDTTGGNRVSILETQEALNDSIQSYEDTIIDQAISRLQEDNEAAALQREKQIELMQAQLDYSVQNGDFNDDVSELLHSAMGADGSLLTDSNLYDLLRQEEAWSAMSDVDKEIWEDQLNSTFKEVSAYLLKEQGEIDGSYLEAVASEINGSIWASASIVGESLEVGMSNIGWNIGSMSQAMDHVTYTYDDAINGLREANAGLANMAMENSALRDALNMEQQYQQSTGGNPDSSAYWQRQHDLEMQNRKRVQHGGQRVGQGGHGIRVYASGGLNTETGPAWLDGTPSKPEYVLDALQTEAFLKLADVLPNFFNNDTNTTNNLGTNMYLDFTINVESLSDDYDVDQLVDRVKDDIYNAASYRNINVVNFLR